ncbi:MAG: hypothetical protein ACI86H_001458, partial [bacterium]
KEYSLNCAMTKKSLKGELLVIIPFLKSKVI